jgi:hypothetical protein
MHDNSRVWSSENGNKTNETGVSNIQQTIHAMPQITVQASHTFGMMLLNKSCQSLEPVLAQNADWYSSDVKGSMT